MDAVLVPVFEFFFNYSWEQFQRGELALAAPVWLPAVAAAAGLLLALLLYRNSRARWFERLGLSALRAAAVAVLVFSLCQPMLLLSSAVPGRSFVGVLIDDSASMGIADGDGPSRGAQAAAAFLPAGGDIQAGAGLYRALTERFNVRLFGFGTDARRLAAGDDSEGTSARLDFSAGQTDLAAALEQSFDAFAGAPLAGLVVVSDGADNGPGGDRLAAALLKLRAAGVPLYTVGVGATRFERDIELDPPRLPARLLVGSAAQAEVTLRHRGYAGREVTLLIEQPERARIVAQRSLTLDDSGATLVRLPLRLDEAGPQRLSVRVAPQPGEQLSENNRREVLLDVYDRNERLLYVEGEPRFELKFIRRAAAADPNLDLAALLRTAENKFYRVGISDPAELSEGFPRDREQLFGYRGLILGNVEAGFFSPQQQQLIVDFVSERGGGLLLLGGKRAFAEGGYGDSLLAEVLPVKLGGRPAGGFAAEVALRPTAGGVDHPLVSLNLDADTPVRPWAELPPLTVVNPISEAKPGASVLLTAQHGNDELLALAQQRYGRGQVLAFPVQNSWLWQMHPDMPLDDQTHEILWQRLLRWLVNDVPERLQARLSAERVSPGETLTLSVDLLDAAYRGVNGAAPQAVLISPTGRERQLRLRQSPASDAGDRADGRYRVSFAAQETGLYELRISHGPSDGGGQQAGAEGEPPSEATAFFQVDPLAHEYFQAEQRTELLARLAQDSGGRFYQLGDAAGLAEDIQYTPSGATVSERRPLWNMPALLLLFVALIGTEWLYRRWRGLA